MFSGSDWLTTKVVSEELGITQTRVLQLIYSGEIQAKKMGGIWLIPAREVHVVGYARERMAKHDRRYNLPSSKFVPF